jgi:3-deoxy-D-manno-octulosonic-acid transferase
MKYKAAFTFYDLAWKIAIPFLRHNFRLAEGFNQRRFRNAKPHAADIWIQAASAGESYLAWELLKNLCPGRPLRIHLTSNTRQGIEILQSAVDHTSNDLIGSDLTISYFPFDRPAVMEAAVKSIHPQVTIFLETELWPGLLAALKKYGCRTLIINGRITEKSFQRYMIWPGLWKELKPDKILAISPEDAKRFAELFDMQSVEIMPNIKFDRLTGSADEFQTDNSLNTLLKPESDFVALASVRQEEESDVEKIILHLRKEYPAAIIGLVPRHLHRAAYWQETLSRLSIPFQMRSEAGQAAAEGSVIIWDKFGELMHVYERAQAAFIGGSLAPLGGQNFLEALTCGVIPVIGPYWENFAWVGREIIQEKLLQVATNWKDAAEMLINHLASPPSRKTVRQKALQFLEKRQGGAVQACRVINHLLETSSKPY